MMNPLYRSTNDPNIDKKLMLAPDNIVNATQYPISNTFFRLQYLYSPILIVRSVKRSSTIATDQKQTLCDSDGVSKKPRQSVLYESGNLYVAESTACVRDTGESIGNGLFTKTDLKQDEVIAEFSGVVLNDEEYDARLKDGRTKKGYSIELKKGLRLDCYENAKVCIHLVLIVYIVIYSNIISMHN